MRYNQCCSGSSTCGQIPGGTDKRRHRYLISHGLRDDGMGRGPFAMLFRRCATWLYSMESTYLCFVLTVSILTGSVRVTWYRWTVY